MDYQAAGVGILFHYLDDFITIGPPDSEECARNMQKFNEMCGELGVPVAEDKTVGPTTYLSFLGIEVDSERLELHLHKKLERVKQPVKEWCGRKAARWRELESLLGLLQHAAKVVSPGRRFVRRIIQALTGVKHGDHYVRLGAEIVRSVMVAQVSRQEEWSGYSPNLKYGSGPPCIRCIRLMGLCSNLEQPVTPMAMEQPSTGVADRSEGTLTNCTGESGLGQRVGRQKCMLLLRQSVSGRGAE